MKNEQFSSEDIMTIYIGKTEGLFQHMKLSGLYQYFMMIQPKHIKMQMQYITTYQRNIFGRI